MAILSATKVLKQYETGTMEIDSRYDMYPSNLREIMEYSHGNVYEAIPNAFRFGYVQGCKAAGSIRK